MHAAWSPSRLLVFRFGVIAAVLWLFPFPLGYLPKTGWLAEVLSAPWQWLVPWFAENVLGTERPIYELTGSGDTLWLWVQALLIAILAALGAAVWSLVDRRRAYPRLQAATIVVLRYYLAAVLLVYGLAKVFPTQFPAPTLARYDQEIGEMSPMGLLWTFMGHSQPYTVFGGLLETTAALLLLFRRTSLAGALVGAGVMTNVVMLNFCYDVPVKLYSSLLLVACLVVIAPHARRLVAVLLGRAVPEVPLRPRGSLRVERLRIAAKVGVLALVALWAVDAHDRWRSYQRPRNALHGTWVVETFRADGVERPPLLTDGQRWRKLIVAERLAVVRRMTDERKKYRDARVDLAAGTLTLGRAVLRFTLPDPEHLVLEGMFGDAHIHVTFVRGPEPLLRSRGFHWVQERPFSR